MVKIDMKDKANALAYKAPHDFLSGCQLTDKRIASKHADSSYLFSVRSDKNNAPPPPTKSKVTQEQN